MTVKSQAEWRTERLENALREIARLGDTNPLDFIESASRIAKDALVGENSDNELRAALLVFAACAHDVKPEEPDDGWARFRLLASDYRRAYRYYVARFGEPPFPEDSHVALATPTSAPSA